MKNDYRPRFLDGYLERHFYRRQPEGILKAQNQSICDLTGIESYSELSYVDLRSNRITDPSPLSGLQSLETLILDDNRVHSLEGLHDLPGLRKFYLRNSLIKDYSSLAQFKNLSHLYLTGSNVSDLSFVRHLPNLRSLYLGRTHICDLSPLADLTNLEVIIVSNTGITNLEPLCNLPKLDTINASRTAVSDLDPLCSLEELRNVIFSYCPIRDLSPLEDSDIIVMDLSFTQTEGIKTIFTMPCLMELDVSGCPLSDPSVTQLREYFQKRRGTLSFEGTQPLPGTGISICSPIIHRHGMTDQNVLWDPEARQRYSAGDPEILRTIRQLKDALENGEWMIMLNQAKKLVYHQPYEPAWCINLMYAMRRSAGVEAALDYACEAYSRFPRHPVILYNLACYQALLGRKKQAGASLQKAIHLEPELLENASIDPDLGSLQNRSIDKRQ